LKFLLKSIQQKGFIVIFTDIRFWILLFFVLRLFNINSPIFDSHNWRQSDGYAIARNFYEIDANILYPRVDHAGNLTGIMGSEFPIMNYIVHLSYYIFDVDWWQGRLLNLILSSLGCFYLYKILKQFINTKIAFSATLFLLSSLWFSHSRKFMPDVFSASLVIIAIYFGWRYLKDNKSYFYLILYFILITFGLLSKLPAFVVVALITPAIFDNSILLKRKLIFILTSIIALIPVLWWYFYWAPKLTSDFGYYYFFMGSSISSSIQFLITDWQGTLQRFYVDAMSYIGFGLYLIGIVLLIVKKEFKILMVFISGSLILFMFMLKGGMTFAHHTYYIMPFVPIMTIVAAYTISLIQIKWLKFILISAVIFEGVANLQHDLMPKPNLDYRLDFENISNTYTQKQDLIAVNNEGNPALLYFAHRKGWSIPSNSNDSKFNEIFIKGCKLIIWDKHNSPEPQIIPHFIKVEENKDYAVYKAE